MPKISDLTSNDAIALTDITITVKESGTSRTRKVTLASLIAFIQEQFGNIYPATDNTYYLGKNDDDTPKAWKGLILKDQAGTGKYYRVDVVNNALTITDLTD